MTARLTIVLPGDALKALRTSQSVTIAAAADMGVRAPASRAAGGESGHPRDGSLPARVLGWAKGRKRPFATADIERKFNLSRAHASMLLSRLASGPHAIRREKRGLYAYGR